MGTKLYNQLHPIQAAEWNRNHKRRWRLKRKQRLIEKLGGKCIKCDFSDLRALQIDHINGGGNKEVKSFTHKDKYYSFIENEITTGRYQILCANCNWIKRYEQKEGRSYG